MKPTILAGMLLTLVIAGCGGGGASSDTTVAAERSPSAKSVVAAEAICSQLIARAGRMGAEFSSSADPSEGTSGALELTTKKLIEPAIPILEGSSRQLRALKPQARSANFDAYVNLFDPILALLHERVEAGEEGDTNRAHELELQLIDLSALQRGLARKAGLKTCDVDYIQTFAAGGHAR
jgi:hypothetical protein